MTEKLGADSEQSPGHDELQKLLSSSTQWINSMNLSSGTLSPKLFKSSQAQGESVAYKSMSEVVERLVKDNEKLTTTTKQQNSQLKKFKGEIHALQSSLDSTRESLERGKVGAMESLAVAVAMFTLVSVNFQLLKDVKEFNHVAGLVLVLSGILFGFVVLLTNMARSDFQPKRNTLGVCILSTISLVLVGGGLYFVHEGGSDQRAVGASPSAESINLQNSPNDAQTKSE